MHRVRACVACGAVGCSDGGTGTRSCAKSCVCAALPSCQMCIWDHDLSKVTQPDIGWQESSVCSWETRTTMVDVVFARTPLRAPLPRDWYRLAAHGRGNVQVEAIGAEDVELRGPIGVFWQSLSSPFQNYPLAADVRHVSVHDAALSDAEMHAATVAHASSAPICASLHSSGAHQTPHPQVGLL